MTNREIHTPKIQSLPKTHGLPTLRPTRELESGLNGMGYDMSQVFLRSKSLPLFRLWGGMYSEENVRFLHSHTKNSKHLDEEIKKLYKIHATIPTKSVKPIVVVADEQGTHGYITERVIGQNLGFHHRGYRADHREQINVVLTDLVIAVRTLHASGIGHGNISLENILVEHPTSEQRPIPNMRLGPPLVTQRPKQEMEIIGEDKRKLEEISMRFRPLLREIGSHDQRRN